MSYGLPGPTSAPPAFSAPLGQGMDGWSEPELILSQFAGEPTLDAEGNIYFIHHYVIDDEIIEADVYVAYRK